MIDYNDEELYEEEYEEYEQENSMRSKIWKRFKYVLIIALVVVIVFFVSKKKNETIKEENTATNNGFSQEYLVHNNLSTDQKLY
jgi:Na+/H+ antiporter NhaC